MTPTIEREVPDYLSKLPLRDMTFLSTISLLATECTTQVIAH